MWKGGEGGQACRREEEGGPVGPVDERGAEGRGPVDEGRGLSEKGAEERGGAVDERGRGEGRKGRSERREKGCRCEELREGSKGGLSM